MPLVPLFWRLGLISACSWISPEWCRCSSDSSSPWRLNSWKAGRWEQETVCDLRNNQLNSPGSCYLWERYQPRQHLTGRDTSCTLGEEGSRTPGFVFRSTTLKHGQLCPWPITNWGQCWASFCFPRGNTPGYSAASTASGSSLLGSLGLMLSLHICAAEGNQHSWVHPTEFWFLNNGLNLQAMIFLFHEMNINFLNFQVGSNQTDTTFYQWACSKIPEKKKSLILDWNHHLN